MSKRAHKQRMLQQKLNKENINWTRDYISYLRKKLADLESKPDKTLWDVMCLRGTKLAIEEESRYLLLQKEHHGSPLRPSPLMAEIETRFKN